MCLSEVACLIAVCALMSAVVQGLSVRSRGRILQGAGVKRALRDAEVEVERSAVKELPASSRSTRSI